MQHSLTTKSIPLAFASLFLGSILVMNPTHLPAQAPTQWGKMDYGSFFSGMFNTPSHAQTNSNPTYKGVAVRLTSDARLSVLFDTELLRYSAGWASGFIELHERSRDGLGDATSAAPAGLMQWTTPPLAGWSSSRAISDPRKHPWGPLPRESAHYEGLHVHGSNVVFQYSIQGTKILDHPSLQWIENEPVFSRTLEIAPHDRPLVMMITDIPSNARVRRGNTAAPNALTWIEDNSVMWIQCATLPAGKSSVDMDTTRGSAILQLAPSRQPIRARVLVWRGTQALLESLDQKADQLGSIIALSPWTHGGPPRWKNPIRTTGQTGTNSGGFALDVITAPYTNPWNSYLRFSGHDFFSDGSAAICSISGDVWTVRGLDDSLSNLEWRRYASGLHEPLGLKIVKDEVFVMCRGQLVRLKDLNGDGEADFHENFNHDTEVFGHGHAFSTELHTDPEGRFLFTACADPDNRPGEHGGSLLRISADGQSLERIATGFRNPNGMTVGKDGRITVADQQGTWVPSSRIDWVRPGKFYGFVPMHHREQPPTTYAPPMLWLPHKMDNSSGGQAWIESDVWGPLKGRLAHLSYGACRLFVVFDEVVDDEPQAAGFMLPIRFNTGVMRARFNPTDGQLYVSGMRGWQTAGTLSGAFYRVRATGTVSPMPVDFHVRPHGVAITFSETLKAEDVRDTAQFAVSRWNYRWTQDYGSAHYSVLDPSKKGEDTVNVVSSTLERDGRTVVLELEDHAPVMQMRVRYRLKTALGISLEGELHNTINRVPKPAGAGNGQ